MQHSFFGFLSHLTSCKWTCRRISTHTDADSFCRDSKPTILIVWRNQSSSMDLQSTWRPCLPLSDRAGSPRCLLMRLPWRSTMIPRSIPVLVLDSLVPFFPSGNVHSEVFQSVLTSALAVARCFSFFGRWRCSVYLWP